MKDIDIGHPSPAVFTHVEHDARGAPVAAFVSRYGDAFCLERPEITLRMRYLETHGMETAEEKKAIGALAHAGG